MNQFTSQQFIYSQEVKGFTMFINFKILFSAALLLSLVIPVFSFKPSGGVLMLDGEDDYAILPLAEHGYIIPRNTDAFTIEVWFYPKTEPKKKERNLVLGQQAAIGLTSENKCELNKNQVCSYGSAFLEGKRVTTAIDIHVLVEKDQWNYMAIIFKDSTLSLAYNDEILRTGRINLVNFVAASVPLGETFRDFFVGGYAEDMIIVKDGELLSRRTYFHGAIDAIRFSNIARHDLPIAHGAWLFDPPQRFLNDEHTLALWDFNDKEGTDHFEDTSGNGYTLIGMNGATTGSALSVNPRNTSITTTWGQVKSDAF